MKEVIWAAIFLTFQGDLEKEVPEGLENLLGTHVGRDYPTITTVLFLLLVFYGLDFAYTKLTKITDDSVLKQQLDGLV